MSSVFVSNSLITGGTFTQVNNNDGQYHRFRESSDILQRSTATAAFHNSKERFDPPKCHPKTRVAVLTEITKWIKWEGDLDDFIMWVYGPAGAGKSAIAQTIAEMCEEEMLLLASFFFPRNDPSRSNVSPLIATIAYQIISNIPHIRESVLAVIERDPLIFTKSLAVQFKSLIVVPLQPLTEAGFFSKPTSRRLIIIDGLDECSDPRIQQNILEVLGNAQRRYRLPLMFLFASRPEQHISHAFNTGLLPTITTRLALDDSYLPDEDIKLFLTDKFQEIKSSHPRRACIPPQWPLLDILEQLVRKSSGQFIYASTVIRYISSIRHKPTDRLDIILGIRPAQKDLPFSELDALYTQILAGVEDIERVLEILSTILLTMGENSRDIEEFLSLQPGDVELYLWDLHSLVNHNRNPYWPIRIFHASLTDFLVDPTRSKTLWINPRARHTAFARRCLEMLQLKGRVETLWIGYHGIAYHLENAEMTPELRDELSRFSFDCLQDVLKEEHNGWRCSIHYFAPRFLQCLQKLPLPEADHIFQTFQANFDMMLCDVIDKYYSCRGFTLLLGSVLQFTNFKPRSFLRFPPGMVASLYLVRQPGERHILYDTGFSAILLSHMGTASEALLNYFIELLQNPERSGTHTFDQRRYATASKECLQLCLCSYQKFSKGTTELAYHDKILLRNKPWAWKVRLGINSRIPKAMRRLTIRQWKSITLTDIFQDDRDSFTQNSLEHEYYRSLSYQWRLDILPIFLEKSVISLELAHLLRSRTFTTMAQRFPRRVKLAREAIRIYLSRVDSAVGGP